MRQYVIGFAVLAAVCLVGVTSRPSNEETTPLTIEIDASDYPETNDNEERSLAYEVNPAEGESSLKAILEKIKAVNDGLKTPKKRVPINYNVEPQTGGGYVIDKDTMEKIQQIIASGKLNPSSLSHTYQESNFLSDDVGGPRSSREMQFELNKLRANQEQLSSVLTNPFIGLSQFPTGLNQQQIPTAPTPYITNMPVLVMPLTNNILNNDLNNAGFDSNLAYSTRQTPSLPFNIPWPLAPFFPVLIRDPLLNYLAGGGWNNLIQYGQSADVCNRKQKSVDDTDVEDNLTNNETLNKLEDDIDLNIVPSSREGRALKKRTVSTKSADFDNSLENFQKVNKLFTLKATTPKPTKQSYVAPQQDTKTVNLDDGDLRFGDWTLFGNRKPIAPSPGFFINRLKVRRGGVAIAGPGGVATAGRGGTAIVGPGGLAYTQPGGLAVAGPHARVVALSPDSDLSSIISRLQDQSATDGSVPRLLEAIPEGKVVAHGPVVYYHPNKQTYYRGWGQYQGGFGGQGSGFSRRSDEQQYNGGKFTKNAWKKDPFWLVLKPVANAITSPRGVAVANPVSHVVISPNDLGTIVHTPVAAAVAGPGGIAHAQSDLYLYDYYRASVDYLPFYGGAKGQYLEIKKDNAGTVTSEKIVSEDKISSDNIVKNSNENLLAKVLAANLQSLKTVSTNLLRLHTLGRRTGSLGNNEKNRFKNQLLTLGEAASNTIKLIDEIGDDIDMLYKSNVTQRKYENDDYIEEEGVGIEAPDEEDDDVPLLSGATIAEAKPVGLAVIGENGLAASRPIATAVASTGVALARPIATAVAGVDPVALGIQFQVNHLKKGSNSQS